MRADILQPYLVRLISSCCSNIFHFLPFSVVLMFVSTKMSAAKLQPVRRLKFPMQVPATGATSGFERRLTPIDLIIAPVMHETGDFEASNLRDMRQVFEEGAPNQNIAPVADAKNNRSAWQPGSFA